MILMATSTGSKSTVAKMRTAGWGILITPDNRDTHGFENFGIDNGAWSAFQRKTEWTPDRWIPLIEKYGQSAMWAVAPDIVLGGPESLQRSLAWLPWMLDRCRRVLIAVQNGMTYEDLAPYVSDRVGIFVGGDDSWKESSLPMWGRLKTDSGCWLHVGRVNTARRIKLAAMSGADSIDGTSAIKWPETIKDITRWEQQGALQLFANPRKRQK
jgi:hypothetical protein